MTSYLRKNTEILICSDKIDIDQLGIGRIEMKKERSPHYFYAISIPRNIQLIIKQKCLEIEANYPFKDWVHERDYHITLAFLGSAPSEVLDEMNRLLVNDLKIFPRLTCILKVCKLLGLRNALVFSGVIYIKKSNYMRFKQLLLKSVKSMDSHGIEEILRHILH